MSRYTLVTKTATLRPPSVSLSIFGTFITRTGGVGPMTIAVLTKNAWHAAEIQDP